VTGEIGERADDVSEHIAEPTLQYGSTAPPLDLRRG
jgi:hypothetical protein